MMSDDKPTKSSSTQLPALKKSTPKGLSRKNKDLLAHYLAEVRKYPLLSREEEKELSSGKIDAKLFAKKSKEYSNLGNIILYAKDFLKFEIQQGPDDAEAPQHPRGGPPPAGELRRGARTC